MLTLARALSREPRVLLADELSMGLAPIIVKRLLESVVRVARQQGTGGAAGGAARAQGARLLRPGVRHASRPRRAQRFGRRPARSHRRDRRPLPHLDRRSRVDYPPTPHRSVGGRRSVGRRDVPVVNTPTTGRRVVRPGDDGLGMRDGPCPVSRSGRVVAGHASVPGEVAADEHLPDARRRRGFAAGVQSIRQPLAVQVGARSGAARDRHRAGRRVVGCVVRGAPARRDQPPARDERRVAGAHSRRRRLAGVRRRPARGDAVHRRRGGERASRATRRSSRCASACRPRSCRSW